MFLSPVAKGVLLGFAGFVVFTFSDASVKLIHGALPVSQSAAIGALFGLFGLPLLKGPGERLSDVCRTVSWPLWLLRFVAYPIGVIGSVLAFTDLPMAEAFVLIFLMPSYVTILSFLWLKERPDRWRWASLVVGFIGVLIVLRPGFRELSLGHLGAIVAGLCGSVTILSTRALGTRETRISLLGAGFLGGIIVCGLIAIPDARMPTPRELGLLASYGLLAMFGNYLVMRGALYAPGAYVGPTQYSQMIWAIGLDYLVFHTTIDLPMAIGIVLIVGSGLMTLIGPGNSGGSGWTRRPRSRLRDAVHRPAPPPMPPRPAA